MRKFPRGLDVARSAFAILTLLLFVLETEAQCNGSIPNGDCQDDRLGVVPLGSSEEQSRTSTPASFEEDQAKEGIHPSGSVAVVVFFIALFNFGFCCCCWCCCRVLDSLNHPFSHRGRMNNRGNAGFPVVQAPAIRVEMSNLENQGNPQAPPKAIRNVVIVNPGGHIEIGVPED